MSNHSNTADGRRALVAELMSREAQNGKPAEMVEQLERLCRAAVHNLGAVGVTVSLMSDSGSAGAVAGSDERSIRIDELQFTLGEGPSHDAFVRRRPVLTADLQSPDGQRWPGYGAAAQEAGVRGVFALPLNIGAAAFGVLNIYRSRPGPLLSQELAMAMTFAEMATEVLLNADGASQERDPNLGVETVLNYRAEIYQAQGAVMVQLGVTLAEALVRMRAHAFVHDVTLADLASGIMAGHIVLAKAVDG